MTDQRSMVGFVGLLVVVGGIASFGPRQTVADVPSVQVERTTVNPHNESPRLEQAGTPSRSGGAVKANDRAACPHGSIMHADQNGDWNASTTWAEAGYPNSLAGSGGVASRCAFINAGVTVYVDDPVEVDGLELDTFAIVKVTKPVNGDLIITSPGQIVSKGEIRVDYDNAVDVSGGEVLLDQNGKYIADPGAGGNVTAQLVSQRVTMLPTTDGTDDQLTYSRKMTVSIAADLVMDSTGLDLCEADPAYCPPRGGSRGGGGTAAGPRGGKTPPILTGRAGVAARSASDGSGRVGPPAALTIEGSFEMIEAAEVAIGCQGLPVSLSGDFRNWSKYPSFFNWTRGKLNLVGIDTQYFEVGGVDFGDTTEGFATTAWTLHEVRPHTNFAMGTIEILPDVEVTFENIFANTVGVGACEEALYVDQLFLGEGSIIHLDNVRVYVHLLVDRGAIIDPIGCGALLSVRRPGIPGRCPFIPAVSEWGLMVLAILMATAATLLLTRRRPQPSGAGH